MLQADGGDCDEGMSLVVSHNINDFCFLTADKVIFQGDDHNVCHNSTRNGVIV